MLAHRGLSVKPGKGPLEACKSGGVDWFFGESSRSSQAGDDVNAEEQGELALGWSPACPVPSSVLSPEQWPCGRQAQAQAGLGAPAPQWLQPDHELSGEGSGEKGGRAGLWCGTGRTLVLFLALISVAGQADGTLGTQAPRINFYFHPNKSHYQAASSLWVPENAFLVTPQEPHFHQQHHHSLAGETRLRAR